jgi:hypothetical protein
VTDAERIERVVYELRDAVARSDVDAVLTHLAPNVEFDRRRILYSPDETRDLIRRTLSQTVFDFVQVSGLRTNVGVQSRRGTAEFRVSAKGQVDSSIGAATIGTARSEWSLGFREIEPHVWKVDRISPVSIPDGVLIRERVDPPPLYNDRDRGSRRGRRR